MSAKHCKETPPSGRSFALIVSLPEVQHLKLFWAWSPLSGLAPEADLGLLVSPVPKWILRPPFLFSPESLPGKVGMKRAEG